MRLITNYEINLCSTLKLNFVYAARWIKMFNWKSFVVVVINMFKSNHIYSYNAICLYHLLQENTNVVYLTLSSITGCMAKFQGLCNACRGFYVVGFKQDYASSAGLHFNNLASEGKASNSRSLSGAWYGLFQSPDSRSFSCLIWIWIYVDCGYVLH